MAVSDFEGYEKRLELHFSGDDPLGLRRVGVDELQQVLDAVQCTIVSAAGNYYFDAYILSESSLFVYPHTIIIKTCGTTRLLRSIPCLLRHAADLGLRLLACRYSRGSFIFPQAQPFPHTSFAGEAGYLQECLPVSLCFRKASLLPSRSPHSSWYVFSAAESAAAPGGDADAFTVEVCMTKLDCELARRFYRKKGDEHLSGDVAGAEMTRSTGIDGINPRALACGFAFHPCGYSMNGLDRAGYSTIHVTPEDGHSYASFECNGRWDGSSGGGGKTMEWLKKAIAVFQPGAVSVSFCMAGSSAAAAVDHEWLQPAVAEALKALGLTCRSKAVEEFPGAGAVTYQTFEAGRQPEVNHIITGGGDGGPRTLHVSIC